MGRYKESSIKSGVTLQIDPNRSRYLGIFLCVSHGGAIAPLFLLPDPAARIALATLVVVNFVVLVRREFLGLSNRSVRSCRLLGNGAWRLDYRNGEAWCGTLSPMTVVWRRVVVLVLADRRCRRAILICSDACAPEEFRRLRAHLRSATGPARGRSVNSAV